LVLLEIKSVFLNSAIKQVIDLCTIQRLPVEIKQTWDLKQHRKNVAYTDRNKSLVIDGKKKTKESPETVSNQVVHPWLHKRFHSEAYTNYTLYSIMSMH